MGFFRQEYWSEFPCPPPGDLPNPGMEPMSLRSLALAGRFLTTSTTYIHTPISHYFSFFFLKPRSPLFYLLRSCLFNILKVGLVLGEGGPVRNPSEHPLNTDFTGNIHVFYNSFHSTTIHQMPAIYYVPGTQY